SDASSPDEDDGTVTVEPKRRVIKPLSDVGSRSKLKR
ncbi:hypothetical protein A2U01_0115537, partial [Trifolium medium]|nr:hypothetical protein [Trifolium medium]